MIKKGSLIEIISGPLEEVFKGQTLEVLNNPLMILNIVLIDIKTEREAFQGWYSINSIKVIQK